MGQTCVTQKDADRCWSKCDAYMNSVSFRSSSGVKYANCKSLVIFMSTLNIWGPAWYHAAQMRALSLQAAWSGNDPGWPHGCMAFVSNASTIGETQAHSCSKGWIEKFDKHADLPAIWAIKSLGQYFIQYDSYLRMFLHLHAEHVGVTCGVLLLKGDFNAELKLSWNLVEQFLLIFVSTIEKENNRLSPQWKSRSPKEQNKTKQKIKQKQRQKNKIK